MTKSFWKMHFRNFECREKLINCNCNWLLKSLFKGNKQDTWQMRIVALDLFLEIISKLVLIYKNTCAKVERERVRERERFNIYLRSIIFSVLFRKELYLLIKFIILQVLDRKHSILGKYYNKCLAISTSWIWSRQMLDDISK